MTKDAKKRKLLTTTGLQLSNYSVTSNNNIIPSKDNYVNSDKNSKYSKSSNGAFEKFIKDNFSNDGTKTYMKDIKLPSKISDLKNALRNIVNTSNDMDTEMKDSLLKLINEANTEAELQSYREDLKPQKAPVKSGTIKITNYRNSKLNSKIVDNALSMIEANKQGRRTKSQWLQVAEQIGMNIKESEIDKYAYKTWSDFLPNQKSNLNRQGEKYVTFTKDEWIKAVEDGYSKANSKKATTRENNKEKVKNTIPPITNDQLKITFERNVDNALKNKSSNGNTILGKVKLNIALKIKDILGIDVSNRIHRLSDYDIRHIMNQHSDADKEAIKGQIPISSSDIKKIPDIIENPSDIVKGTDNKLGETIRYIKEYNDNTTFVVEVVPENSADLIIKTMWKKPSTLTNIENNLSSTSETKGSDISSTINNIIPSEQNYVNNIKKTMNPTEIANLKPEDASSTPDLQSRNYEKGDKQSSFYKNITNNSKFLNSELRKELKNEDDIKYYKSVTNEESLTEALKRLDNDGASETSRWFVILLY